MDVNEAKKLDAEAFARAHDDGRSIATIAGADVVLVGVSGTGKTAVALSLAARGVRAANVPFVPGRGLPGALDRVGGAGIVALSAKAGVLVKIRRLRVGRFGEPLGTDHYRVDAVRRELLAAHRLYGEKGWPVVDVSEQTPASAADLVLALVGGRTRAWP